MEDKFLKLAKKILVIDNKGFDITVSKITNNEFNVESGEYEKTNKEINGKAIYLNIKEGEFKNKSYLLENFKSYLLIYCEEEIKIDNKIILNGEMYNILNINKIKSRDITVLYKVLIG